MKLKKIASLALAGVMAASMLAGCNTGSSNSNSTPNQGETETVPTSAVVSAFNSKQNASSAVKVEFAGDAEMEKNLKEAVEMAGAGATASTVLNYYKAITGDTYKYKTILVATEATGTSGVSSVLSRYNNQKLWASLGMYDNSYYQNMPAIANVKDGTSNTWMLLVSVDATAAVQSPMVAANNVATQVNNYILKNLDADRYANTVHTAGEDYLSYSYAGTAGAVTGMDNDGKPVYYIAMTLTQNVSVETTPEV